MRQLFTVGAILAGVLFSGALRAQNLPLIEVELGPREREDIARLASANSPSEMLRLLDEHHPDLEIRTLDKGPEHRGHYEGRFETGPRGVLWTSMTIERDEILHEYLHYLIDRVRLRKHAEHTIALGKSYLQWRNEEGWRLELEGTETDFKKIRYLRQAFEGVLLGNGEEVEIVIYLIEHARELHLGDLKRQSIYATEKMLGVHEHWQRLSEIAWPMLGASLPDARRFVQVGERLGQAHRVLGPCSGWL